MRRVDRFAGLLGREVGAAIEAALVSCEELPPRAVVGARPGWLGALSVAVDSNGGRALVSFAVDLGKLAVMGVEAQAAND
mgnify:CR=1 FL=1